jgi:DNA-binding NtrC family response regulator
VLALNARSEATLPRDDRTTGGAILLYENDVSCAQSFANILCSAGHTVQITNHFMPALVALEAEQPIDVFLADVVFPEGGVNGMALARMALVRRPGLKVIYVTGHDVPRLDKEASGPILRKPVSDDQLLAWVDRALAATHEFWWQ